MSIAAWVPGLWLQLGAVQVESEAAAPERTIQVAPDGCAREQRGIDWPRVEQIVDIEDRHTGTRPERATVLLTCIPDGVRLSIPIQAGTPRAKRDLVLAELDPSVRDRVLALAIVELAHDPPRAPFPAPSPGPPPSLPAEAPRWRPWQLDVSPVGRWFVNTKSWFAGAELGVTHRPRPLFGWRAAVELGGGRMSTTPGEVGLTVLSALATARLHRTKGTANFYGGLGVRGGFVHLRSLPRPGAGPGSAFDGGWFGPVLALGTDLLAGRRLVVGPAIEAGYSLVGAQAKVLGDRGPGAAGLWVSARIGVGWIVGSSRKKP